MPRIKATIGVDARHAGSYDDAVEQALRDAATDKNVGAIGSCGIADAQDAQQAEAFSRQVKLAAALGLALVVEAGTAAADALMLQTIRQHGPSPARVLVRMADPRATAAHVQPWAEAGCYVSFAAPMADDVLVLADAVRAVPADRVLVESGAPERGLALLAGEPARADQVVFAADAIIATVPASQLTANFKALFGMK